MTLQWKIQWVLSMCSLSITVVLYSFTTSTKILGWCPWRCPPSLSCFSLMLRGFWPTSQLFSLRIGPSHSDQPQITLFVAAASLTRFTSHHTFTWDTSFIRGRISTTSSTVFTSTPFHSRAYLLERVSFLSQLWIGWSAWLSQNFTHCLTNLSSSLFGFSFAEFIQGSCFGSPTEMLKRNPTRRVHDSCLIIIVIGFRKVVCLIVEAMHGPVSDIWSLTTCIFILGGVLCYAIVGICIKFKIGKTDTTRKLLKSLVILTLIMLCSWFFTSASMIFVSVWKLSEQYAFFVPLYTGITINAACAANFFILFKFR